MRILFLAPHWKVALVRAFQESPEGKPTLIGADSDPHSPALSVVDRSFLIPAFSQPGCLDEILDICRTEEVPTILPLTNKAIRFLDTHRNRFEPASRLSYLPDHETIQLCIDKRRLSDFLKSEGIPHPERIDGGDRFPGFPLIAKEACGEGGKNSFRIDDQADLDYYSRKFPDHVFQRFVQGREFSIDWFSDQSGFPHVIVPRERVAVRGGEVMVSRIDLDPGIIAVAARLGKRLHLRGPANLQGILDPEGEFFITDINLRFGSGAVHTVHAGADIPGMILREISGQPVQNVSNSVANGSLMTRHHEALFKP